MLYSLFGWWLITELPKPLFRQPQETQLASEGLRAQTAFKCIVSLVISQIFINSVLSFVFMGNRINDLNVLVIVYMCSYATFLFITILFVRLTFGSFLVSHFDFRRPKRQAALFSFGCGVILAVFFLLINRNSAGRSELATQFFQFGRVGVRDFDVLVLLTPFPEELIIRGYFYRAIRYGYSVFISISYVLGTLLFSHASLMFSSSTAAAALISANIVACLLREKTNSIWNCIMFHFVYNLTCILVAYS